MNFETSLNLDGNPARMGGPADPTFFRIGPGQPSMATQQPTVDQIVQELLDRSGTKAERMKLFRELIRRGEDVPDDLLNSALQKLMERLAE